MKTLAMKTLAMNILVVPGLLAVASTASAQAPADASAAEPIVALEEIIVTARRKSESLQDVPQSVSAVTSDVIEKLAILKFEDVAAVVPGLNMGSGLSAPGGAAGSGTSTAMRGVSFSPDSQTSASVEFYLNDALIESNFLFQSMFDVGQIEVLRGPQGTLRGRSAPSGAITLTTRKPNLSQIGGYVSATGSNRDATNVQGAFNMPVISDVLAVRIAALDDRNEADGVKSVNSSVDPSSETKAGRISLRFEPTDSIAADLMFQHMERDNAVFANVIGNGRGDAQRPVIRLGDRLGVTDGPFTVRQKLDAVTGNVSWAFAGQQLAYVGSYNELSINAHTPFDVGNQILGQDIAQTRKTTQRQMTQELRLASEEMVAGFFDYTAGVFYAETKSPTTFDQVSTFLSGAFGTPVAPALPDPSIFNSQYQVLTNASLALEKKETSVFASVTLHLGDRTELALGGRYIEFKNTRVLSSVTNRTLIAQSTGTTPCSFIPGAVGSTYTNSCDFVAVATTVTPSDPVTIKEQPFVYNAALSHHLTDAVLVYANMGTAWRSGTTALGVNNGQNDPNLQAQVDIPSEDSISYEIGFKSTFWDNRARVNLAVYHQEFDGLIFTTQPTPYVSCRSASDASCSLDPTKSFATSADAVVDGIDVETNFVLTDRWNVGLGVGYADGKVDNDFIPCTPPDFNPSATTARTSSSAFSASGSNIYLCQSSSSVSRFPPWTATLQSEYSMPITNSFDGYIRGLYTEFAENKDRSPNFVASQYGLLNLFAGVRSPEGNWEISAFVKNALDEEQQLSQDVAIGAGNASAFFGSSGYQRASYTPLREFGLSVRYAFGSF